MVFRSKYFDDLIASLLNGTRLLHGPKAGGQCTVKQQTMLVEADLFAAPQLQRSLARLAQPDVRYHFRDVPARRIRGPLCLIALLVHHRLVDIFFVETKDGYCVVAVYSNEAQAAFTLIDELQQVPFAAAAEDCLTYQA